MNLSKTFGLVIPGLLALTIYCPAWARDGDGARVPGSWWLDLRTTGYFYESVDRSDDQQQFHRLQQRLTGSATGLGGGRLSVRVSGSYDEELRFDDRALETTHLYLGYLEARPRPGLRLRAGRQYVASGVAALSLDGLWLDWRGGGRGRRNLTAWAGAHSPLGRNIEWGGLDTDRTAGLRLGLSPARRYDLWLSGAYRERDGRLAERPLSLELRARPVAEAVLRGRAAFDLEADRWQRLEAQARLRPTGNLPSLFIQFVDRRPRVDAGSWFARFARNRRRLVRGTLEHRLDSGWGGELEYLGSSTKGRSSSRLGGALLASFGRLGYSVRLGDIGEESRIYGEASHRPTRGLQVGASAAFLTYALLDDAPDWDERQWHSYSAWLRARLRRGLDLRAEVQSLDNALYERDIRFLLAVRWSLAGGAAARVPGEAWR